VRGLLESGELELAPQVGHVRAVLEQLAPEVAHQAAEVLGPGALLLAELLPGAVEQFAGLPVVLRPLVERVEQALAGLSAARTVSDDLAQHAVLLADQAAEQVAGLGDHRV